MRPVICLLAMALALFPGCSQDSDAGPGLGDGAASSPGADAWGGSGDKPADAHRALLAGIAERVILVTYAEFVTATGDLVETTSAYVESPSAATQEAARSSFQVAMDTWQRAELLQIGPAGSMTSALGGEDRRDEIYSWPSVNTCRVDQELTEEAYLDAEAFAEELPNVRGLDTMEYLLYPPESGNGCKSSSKINKEGTWEALVASGALEAHRAAYSATVAVLLELEAKALLGRWLDGSVVTGDAAGELNEATGFFLEEFTNAGAGSETYPTAQDGLNAVSDAMFYLDKITKDMKLAMPAGISGCEDDVCPDGLESQHAHRSAENVLQNIIALQALFHGTYGEPGEADGFDDLLISIGNATLASDMTSKLEAARGAAAEVEGSLVELLESDPQAVVDIHAAIKSFTDLLKTEFVATLDLALPKSAAGDND